MKFNIKNKHKYKSGIYKITNTINGKVYIGKTNNFYKRYYQYLYAINNRKTKHINEYMLNSIIKYKSTNFRFEIIEIINKSKDNSFFSQRELHWMDYYNSCSKNKGYNLRRDSSSQLITHPSTSLKISNRLKEEWKSGIRSNHGLKLKKNWENNDIRRKNQSELFKKSKTKYKYILEKDNQIEECEYQRLVDLNLNNCITTMCRSKKDSIMFKKYKITRIKLKI